jgi:hypothetical protein
MLWRLHIRSASVGGKTHGDIVNYCVANSVAGIGWPVEGLPKDAAEYVAMVRHRYGKRTASCTFAEQPVPGDFIWARDPAGIYYLGKVAGEWKYVDTPQSRELDIPNQRACHWIKVGNEEKVPGKVIACFRPRRAFQSISDAQLESFTAWFFEKEGKEHAPVFPKMGLDRIFTYLNDRDCEDLVGLFIQHEYGYLLIPSSCKKDTMAIEYILKHRESGEAAVAQVKQGNVDLDDRLTGMAPKVFLFTSSGKVTSAVPESVEVISPQRLIDFCQKYPYLLPERIMNWLRYAA